MFPKGPEIGIYFSLKNVKWKKRQILFVIEFSFVNNLFHTFGELFQLSQPQFPYL